MLSIKDIMAEKILMVCLGNICRSPTAEGILRQKAEQRGVALEIDSAGTGGWHAGEQPDPRAQAAAKKRGIDISYQRARQLTASDFDNFDRIYVMDESNYQNALMLARNIEHRQKVKMILDEVYPGKRMPVPDPYFGGEQGFDHVYDLLSEATDAILDDIENKQK